MPGWGRDHWGEGSRIIRIKAREDPMVRLFHASSTMFVYVNGHHLIEFYFCISDARKAANDLVQAASG